MLLSGPVNVGMNTRGIGARGAPIGSYCDERLYYRFLLFLKREDAATTAQSWRNRSSYSLVRTMVISTTVSSSPSKE